MSECERSVPRLPRKRGGDPGTPEGRQGLHPTPWQCTLSHACHAKEAETSDARGTPGRTSDPLAAHCPTPATQKRRKGRQRDTRPIGTRLPRKRDGDPGTPGRTSNPWQCTLSTPAMQKRRRPRDARGTPGRTSDPLAVHIVPRLQHKMRWRPRDARRTPGRTSNPLAAHIAPRLPCKRGGDPGTPEGRQGVHPTHACHAKDAEPKGRQGVQPSE